MTGASSNAHRVSLVSVSSDGGESDDLGNEFGKMLQSFKGHGMRGFCSPVYGSGAVRCAVLCFIMAAAAVYAYFAVCPPGFIRFSTRALYLPAFMDHVVVGIVPTLLALFTLRGQLARSFMSRGRDEAPSILNDIELVEKVFSGKPPHHTRCCGLTCWLLLLLACLLAFQQLLIPRKYIYRSVAFYLPAVVAGAMSLHGPQVMTDVIKMSYALAESLCYRLDELEDGLKGLTERKPGSERDLEAQHVDFWQGLTQQHLAMDEQLEELWLLKNAGHLLLADILCRVVWILFLLFLTFLSHHLCVQVVGLFAACLATLRMLQYLVPVAEVTSLCRSVGSTQRSIARLTIRFVNHPQLSKEAKAEHARFLQYITAAPAGIKMPVLGLVTMEMLASAAKVVAAVGPTVLTFMLNSRGARAP